MVTDAEGAIVEIVRESNESNSSVLRRFSRKVNSSGIIQLVKQGRFKERTKSENVRKKEALRRIERGVVFRKLYKQGKIPVSTKSRPF